MRRPPEESQWSPAERVPESQQDSPPLLPLPGLFVNASAFTPEILDRNYMSMKFIKKDRKEKDQRCWRLMDELGGQDVFPRTNCSECEHGELKAAVRKRCKSLQKWQKD